MSPRQNSISKGISIGVFVVVILGSIVAAGLEYGAQSNALTYPQRMLYPR